MPNFKADLRVNLLTTQSPFKSACLLKEVYIFLKSLNNYEARNFGVRVTVPPPQMNVYQFAIYYNVSLDRVYGT